MLWQYSVQLEEYESVAALPQATDEDLLQKAQIVMGIFASMDPVSFVAYAGSPMCPYYIQSYLELGNIAAGVSWLRDTGAEIRNLPENEGDLMLRLWAPVVVSSGLGYNAAYREELIAFMNTTEKDIIKIVACSDP